MYGHRMEPGHWLMEQTFEQSGTLFPYYREDFHLLWDASGPYPKLPEAALGERPTRIAVIGPGDADANLLQTAGQVGEAIASAGAVLVCGGLGGVMRAAAAGAAKAVPNGRRIGYLPGLDTREGNAFLTQTYATGKGEARDFDVVDAADAVIAVGANPGTMIEACYALKSGKNLITLHFWSVRSGRARIDIGTPATSAADAVQSALTLTRQPAP